MPDTIREVLELCDKELQEYGTILYVLQELHNGNELILEAVLGEIIEATKAIIYDSGLFY